MTYLRVRKNGLRAAGQRARRVALLALVPLLGLTTCDAFNPGFVALLDTGGTLATVPNAPGHVVETFVNNAEVDERLIAFLESAQGGSLTLTPVERRALRPRVRVPVLITFTDGTRQSFEFVSGTTSLVEAGFDAESEPDLNENNLDNVVVICDVANVEVDPGNPISVFVPVEITAWQRTEIENDAGGTDVIFDPVDTDPPQFRVLQVDLLTAEGEVDTRRNVGVRDVPSPVDNPFCGSVIAITLNGVLSVPFLEGVDDTPSYDVGDIEQEAGIGGRYEFIVSVQ